MKRKITLKMGGLDYLEAEAVGIQGDKLLVLFLLQENSTGDVPGCYFEKGNENSFHYKEILGAGYFLESTFITITHNEFKRVYDEFWVEAHESEYVDTE